MIGHGGLLLFDEVGAGNDFGLDGLSMLGIKCAADVGLCLLIRAMKVFLRSGTPETSVRITIRYVEGTARNIQMHPRETMSRIAS